MTLANSALPETEVIDDSIDLASLLEEIVAAMGRIQDSIDGISDTQSEILEKLDNLGLGDGLGLTEFES